MELKIRNKTITLNERQIEGVRSLWRFLYDESERESLFFTLSGVAGTGKTTILKKVLQGDKELKIREYNSSECAVSAPTHQAKKVIARATGIQSTTIQSLVGLKPNAELEEFTNTNVVFDLIGNCRLHDYRLIIIDESSMLQKDLVDHIKRVANENLNILKRSGAIRWKVPTKIIFMGDSHQLPPIADNNVDPKTGKRPEKMVVSSVFIDPEIKQFALNKVERQKDGNPLLTLYSQILSNIDSPMDMFERVDNTKQIESDHGLTIDENGKLVADVGYKFYTNGTDFSGEALKKFAVFGEYSNSKILCYQNEQAVKWNKYVRKIVCENYEDQVCAGDILTSYRSVLDPNGKKMMITENSAEYKVVSAEIGFQSQMYYENHKEVEGKLKVWNCFIEDLETGMGNMISIVHKDSYDLFYKIDQDKVNFAKSKKAGKERSYAWAVYYDFRDRFFLLGNIYYQNGEIACRKDFDYYYAITTHKSQGSTYENVFLDEGDMNIIRERPLLNRLKYVAASRPTDMCHFFKK